jgi:large conductance mechanosensitive channel
MLGMFTEFREFLLHGNLVELAVAVVIGTAFATLVSTFTSGLITRLIAALGKAPHFSALSFTINESKFRYGAFLNALVSLAVTARGFLLRGQAAQHAHRPPQGPTAAGEETRKCPGASARSRCGRGAAHSAPRRSSRRPRRELSSS